MIDATQAAIVAYMTEHGEIIHDHHLVGAEVWDAAEQAARDRGQPVGQGWRVFDEVIEAAGYTPLIRYSIHEMESADLDDRVSYLAGLGTGELREDFPGLDEAIEEGDISEDDDDAIRDWLYDNVEAEVLCDECGERIE
jgi:hypothetical protein